MKPRCGLITLRGLPILEQLLIEEKLYRNSVKNWCIVNRGSQRPTVVMGIGGKTEKLIDISLVKQRGIQVVRRFTGGGTVVIDQDSLFASLIGSFADIGCRKGPKELMQWSERFYKPAFDSVRAASARQAGHEFALRENDYVIGDRKFGGNAQGISRERFVHHTSFLWDYQSDNMRCLLLPEKTPEYRHQRPHEQFLCKLKDVLTEQDALEAAWRFRLQEVFDVHEVSVEDALSTCSESRSAPSTQIEIL